MKNMTKALAVFLVLVLMMQLFPLSVFADDTAGSVQVDVTQTAEAAPEAAAVSEEEQFHTRVIGEVSELRSQSEKHFRMNDGSFVAVDYGAPVHFSDDGGETWEDIDNTLALSRDDAELYVAKNGDSVRGFAANTDSGLLFSLSDGAYGLRMGLSESFDNADGEPRSSLSKAEISYPDEKDRSSDDAAISKQVTPAKLRTDVRYSNVYSGVDFLYELNGYNVKESILVKDRLDSYTFSFYMEMDGLTPELKEAGSIELTDETGEVVYLIPAPFMIDASGAESGAVSYAITKGENNSWSLTVTADADWMNSEERAYPITIDPTVILYPYSGSDNILTSYVNSDRPTTASYHNAYLLRSGYCTNTPYDPDCTGYTVGLIYFKTLPKVPDHCLVTDAQLGLTQVQYNGWGTENYHKLYATTISTPSNPKTYLSGMTWNSYTANILPYYATLSGESVPTALDYQMEIEHAGQETMYGITNAVQRWYDQSDASISRLLVLDDGHTNAHNARVTYGGYAYGSAYAPKIYVTYRNTVGIESIYGYHTQNIGRAGTGYVNDYTLHSTLAVPVLSAPSNTLPFSINLIYNQDLSDSFFTADTTNPYSDASNIHTLYYTNAKAGYGWKASVQQTLKYVFYYVDGDYLQYLVYTDADGTEHYFNRSNSGGTVYKDEDGLGLTITTYDVDLFTMKDKENNTWEFTWGYLTRYADSNGNQLFYAYDGVDYSANSTSWKPANKTSTHRVTGVWRKNDGGDLQKVATLTYSGEYLSTIKDAANRTTMLGYDDGKLISLTFPDGKTASYAYSSWTNASGKTYYRLSQASDNEANYRIDYNYWSNNPLQLQYYMESTKSGESWLTGQRVNCFQAYANYSRFRYFDANSYSGNGKFVTRHYFDSWGRTVNVVTMNPEETEILGASMGTYTENSEDSDTNNRLTNAATAGVQSVNLLQNADLEHATSLYGWTKDTLSHCNAASKASSGTTVSVSPHLGQALMKLYEESDNLGEYKVQQPVYLEKGKTYVFSAYVNTACTVTFGENGGAYLTFLQGTTQKAKSRVINYNTSTTVEAGWERLSVAYTPSASGTYAVAANVNNISRVVVFDNFQLEKTLGLNGPDLSSAGGLAGTASAFNLLQAGSFEFPNSSTGYGDRTNVSQWWTYNSSKACPTNAKAHSGSFGLTFAPSVTEKQRASQVIPINGSSNKTYILSGWGWTPQTNIKSSKEMEGDNENECRFFGLIAEVAYTDTTLEHDYHYVSFNDNIDQWQFASGVIVPKQRDKTVSTITVSACLDYCANRTYMDDVSLIQEPVQTYEYDEKGNLISATNSEGKSTTTLDGKDRITGYTAITGVSYELSYSGNSRDPEWIRSDGITTSYTYDAAGNVTQTKTQAPNNGKYLQSDAEYDATKNFVTETTDTNGSTVTSNYDAATGTLTTAADPKGTVTHHLYVSGNARIRLTYMTGLDALHYNYNQKGQLEELSRKSFDPNQNEFWQGYHFDYDAWGNTEEIKVWKPTSGTAATPTGDTASLAKYQHNSNGTLSRMEYPNGDYVIYSYDLLDRLVKEVYYNSDDSIQVEYQYIYSSDGQLAKQQAIRNGTVVESYRFEYDSLGRLIRSREGGDNNSVQRTEHLYDGANRLTAQNWTVGERSFTEAYAYDAADGTMSAMLATYDDGSGWFARDMLTYTYDDLNRLTQVLDTENYSTQFYTRNYTYQDLSGDRTTSRLAQYVYRKPSDSSIINGNSYAYDANGNITQINEVYTVNGADASRTLAVYTYDDLNQLTQETRYTYAGTSTTPATTTTVNYTIDTAGNLRSVTGGEHSVSYTYADTAWSDKLTGITVDGVTRTITYADAANPFNWYNGTDYTNLTWTRGRRLGSVTKGSDLYSYEYDMSGVRSVKVADGLRHEYVTQNGRVVRESVYGLNSNTGEYTVFQYALDFLYDESGHPFLMRRYYNEAQTSYNTYHYVLNAQGDVIKLLHGQNTTVAEYTYDAWGNVLTATGSLADVNPLRYRGYYYDTETGFYYLQSRYYDPIVKRFLNADSYASTGQGFLGHNMFAYCGNGPVAKSDPFGTMAGSSSCISVCADYSYNPGSTNLSTGDDSLDSAIKQTVNDIINREYNEVRIKNVSVSNTTIPHRGPTAGDWVEDFLGAGFSFSSFTMSIIGIGGVALIILQSGQLLYKDSLFEDGNYPGCIVQIEWEEVVYTSYRKDAGTVYVHNTTMYYIKYNDTYQTYPFLGEDEVIDFYTFVGGNQK